jgi:hypothetical protein
MMACFFWFSLYFCGSLDEDYGENRLLRFLGLRSLKEGIDF